ncbi:MAG: response regulator [Chloroflexi bacterium]|nr:response regulator [Chloroflexota bacterium]
MKVRKVGNVEMREITVLIVDEHTEVRELLARRLDDQPDFSVIGRTGDAAIAAHIASFWEPDIILLDPRRSERVSPEPYGLIARASPTSGIVIFSSYVGSQEEEVCRCMAGRFCLAKSIGFETLLAHLRRLAAAPALASARSSRCVKLP